MTSTKLAMRKVDAGVFFAAAITYSSGLFCGAVPSFLREESDEIDALEELHVRRHVPDVSEFARIHGYRDPRSPEWTALLRDAYCQGSSVSLLQDLPVIDRGSFVRAPHMGKCNAAKRPIRMNNHV